MTSWSTNDGPLSRKLGHVRAIVDFNFNFYRPNTGLLELKGKSEKVGKNYLMSRLANFAKFSPDPAVSCG
jgi:hypothetical protein